MKTRTKLIVLAGLAVASSMVANRIKQTHDLKPSVKIKLPESKTVLLKASSKSSLSKTLIKSYIAQITEMTTLLDSNKNVSLIHYIAADDKHLPVIDTAMVTCGYEKFSENIHHKYQKSVQANDQTILDEVVFVAQIAKSHKQEYLGWDFGK